MADLSYAVVYIIRFQGTLTQGRNAGKAYTYENSWGGVFFNTIKEAYERVEMYKKLEPELHSFKVFSRQYDPKTKSFVEIEF